MGCIYNDFNGKCTFFDEEVNDPNLGTDKEGNCICEDDECPTNQCTYFEDNENE